MGKCADKNKQRYEDRKRDRSKITCAINGPGHYSEQCKFLNKFSTNYYEGRT